MMKRILALLLVVMFAAGTISAKETVNIIFDTDLGNDIDDAMALAVVHALEARGELKLLAVTSTKDNKYVAPMADAINTFYGRPDIPIGVVQSGVTPEDGKYLKQVVEMKNADGSPVFPRKITPETKLPDAVGLLRKTLAAAEDGGVVIVQIGFFTNLARLLDTPGDAVSPLSGKELVARKVKLLSLMAGEFYPLPSKRKEYNVVKDIPSARKVVAEWPGDMVFSGHEIGRMIQYPAASMGEDFDYVPAHPVKEGYRFYRGLENDQPTYDLNSVLYAARPNRGYYTLSRPGVVSVSEEGVTSFRADAAGKHRYQIVNGEQIAAVREALVQLTSEPRH